MVTYSDHQRKLLPFVSFSPLLSRSSPPKSSSPAMALNKDPVFGWYDVENCLVPLNYDAVLLGRRIKEYLVNKGFVGDFVRKGIVANRDRIIPKIQKELNHLDSGINFTHLHNYTHKQVSDMEILAQISEWNCVNNPPGVVLIISGDRGFVHELKALNNAGYVTICIHRSDAAAAKELKEAATHTWIWNDVISPGNTSSPHTKKTKRNQKASSSSSSSQR